MIITVLIAALLAAVVVALVVGLRGGRRLSAAKLAAMSGGTLTLTGVSPRPDRGDAKNQAFVTVSGTVIGADIAPTEVYGGFVWSLDTPWPAIGQDLPVRYDPRKVDSTWVISSEPHTPEWTG